MEYHAQLYLGPSLSCHPDGLSEHLPPVGGVGVGGVGVGPTPPQIVGLHWLPQIPGNSSPHTRLQACCSDMFMLALTQSIQALTACPFVILFKIEEVQDEQPHLKDWSDLGVISCSVASVY